MSSSSALVVAVAAALVRLAGLESRAEWQANITGDLEAAGYYACLENGLSFGSLAGDGGVGTHGGSEDHAAIVAGRRGCVTAFAFVPMRRIGDARLPDGWRFVIAPSGVRAAKTGAAMEPYNRLSRGSRILTALAAAGRQEECSLATALADGDGPLRDRIRRSNVEGWSPAALEARLDHFIREDARVGDAFDAFRAGDRPAIARLAAASQSDAEALLGNQVPETVALARSALACGAFAASSFGAGFGGSVWALVEAERAAVFAADWHRDAFVAVPGPPLTELTRC